MGRIDKNGILYITGRAKELIITAGGENIPPILIEQEVLATLPFVSQVMLVGERRKYLTCLIAIKESAPGSGKIESSAKHYLGLKGEEISTIEQARQSKIVANLINAGLKQANDKAISRAQIVQDYHIMPEEFSVENGLLTPTMKLKRKEAEKKYIKEIEQMYLKAKL
jgi:long-chain-fatty-acid--CoA ligase ACSBG